MPNAPAHPKLQHLFDHHSGLILIGVLVIVIVSVATYSWYRTPVATPSITNFEQCVTSTGSRILESYPEQCVTADGQTFVNTQANVSPLPSQTSPSATPVQ